MKLRDLDILSVDYSAANPDYRRTEIHKVSDLNGYFLIPFEGPMFVRNMVVRADGAILTIEKDYTIEDDFTQLELMTGKKVIGSLRIKDHIVKDYKEIKLTYQKVGEFTVSREFLINSAEVILNNPKPIDWLTQVFGKPDTYPPAFHTHDISSSDEMVGFGDLLLLFKQASGQTKMYGLEIWNKLKAVEEKAYKTLGDNYESLWNKMFTHIMNVNVPHPMTKADIGLSDHPNYGTATLAEDQDAAFYAYNENDSNGNLILKTDKISTPKGVHNAIDTFDPDTDGYVRQGTLPFSYYGSGFYLPPPIKGSFEGLGSDIGTAAMCLESNGVTTAIIRGYDSKVKSLYYYYNENIYDTSKKFIFSGVKYTHPLVEADNIAAKQAYIAANGSDTGYIPIDVNHVIAGSSGQLLCIGDYEKRKYYIGLGNGTLDANSHTLKRIDNENFNDKVEGNVFDPYRSCVMLIGDYVYIIAQINKWPVNYPEEQKFGTKISSYRTRIFYRANKSDLSDPSTSTITFVQQTINFDDLEGKRHFNQKIVDPVPTVIGTTADGKPYCKTMWVDFEVKDPTFTDIRLSPYHAQWIYKENPNDKTKAAIRFLHGIQYWYYGVRTVGENLHAAVPYTFDTTTNTLALDPAWFKITFNIETGKRTAPEGKNIDDWYSGGISPFVGNFDEVGAAWIDKIGIASIGTRVLGLPYNPYIWFGRNFDSKGQGDQWAYFNDNFNTPSYYNVSIPMESPFGFTSIPALMCDLWQYNGKINNTPVEMFRAMDANAQRALFYRVADNVDYEKHDDLRFPYVNKEIYARTPNARFGTVTIAGSNSAGARNLPSINYPYKDANSTQYGIFRLGSQNNDKTFPYYFSELYTFSEENTGSGTMSADGGFYVDTLATHDIDDENNVLTVTPNKAGRLWISKETWRGLLATLLGDDNGLVNANGLANGGEYLMTVYMAQPASGKNVPFSMAMVFYHQISTDPLVAKKAYMNAIAFDWSISGTTSDGVGIAKIGATRRLKQEPTKNAGYENFNRISTGEWINGPSYQYQFPNVTPSVQLYGTSKDDVDVWFSCGVQFPTVGGSNTPAFIYRKHNGVESFQERWSGMYVLNSTGESFQALYNNGLQQSIPGSISGGGAYYTLRPDGAYNLVEAVFVKGNWTIFISTDLNVIFNGTSKPLKARNYSLDQLGIDPANKTFYLYAVCGKTEGYYDLTLSEKTASPYHMLVATITTISTGIKTIETNEVFAISGFQISTNNHGGIVPATSGTFPEDGTFEAILAKDLFDKSKY